jgi:hypothetical protein
MRSLRVSHITIYRASSQKNRLMIVRIYQIIEYTVN